MQLLRSGHGSGSCGDSTTPTFIAGLIGLKTFDVQTSARARYGAVSQPSNGLYPFTRRNMAFTYNQQVTLRVLDDADAMPGYFGWLTWDGSDNASALVQALTPPGTSKLYYNPGTPANNWAANRDDHALTLGKWVQGVPGNKSARCARATGLVHQHADAADHPAVRRGGRQRVTLELPVEALRRSCSRAMTLRD